MVFSSYDMNAASWLVNICAHNRVTFSEFFIEFIFNLHITLQHSYWTVSLICYNKCKLL